jgi:hypothetical protein
MQLSEPCEPRPIRFLDLLQPGQWRVKVYGIAHHRRAMAGPDLEASLADRLSEDA